MLIESIATDTLTVLRGALGTTAATHTTSTTVYIIETAYFAGSIDEIDTVPLSTDKDSHVYAVACVDWNQLADRFLVLATFTSETTGDIAESLINDTGLYPQLRTSDTIASTESVSAALTTSSGYVAPGVDVTEINFNYKTLAECLDWLAGLTDYYWNIDYNKRLIFGEFDETVTAITEANKGTYIRYHSEKKTQTRSQYRNVQFLRGGFAVEPEATENFNTATTGVWKHRVTLTRPVGAAIDDADITVGGSAISGGVGVKNISTGKGAYYQIGDHEIEIAASIVGTPTIAVTYKGQVPIMLSASNEEAVEDRADNEGGSGTYAMIETAPDLNAVDGFDRSRALVERYGILPVQVEYSSTTVTWAAGSKQTITLDSLNLSSQACIITQRRIYDRGAGNLEARYTLESSIHRARWVDWYTKIYNNQLRTFADNEVLSYGRTYENDIARPVPF
jgi:hypothetical protein